MVRKANFRSVSAVSSPARNQVSDSHVGWLASAAGNTKCGSPGTSSNGYRRQSSPTRTPRFLFCYVSSNSNFSATGGDAVTDYINKRFPFAPFPKGWFQVAYSREVDTGQIIGLHYFGRRLICYRGEAGTPYVLDAYC